MNISEKDVPIPKFHPTVFDSISIATSIAISKGVNPANVAGLKARRVELLKDQNYKGFIRNETMTIPHIKGRIGLAAKFLYDIDL